MSRLGEAYTLTFAQAFAIACCLLLAAGVANAAYDSPTTVRIENVKTVPRDAKTATVKFDIAWDDSWRNETNHDAAWVFFKVRAEGAAQWQHVRLVADKVLNPTGYSQEKGGTPLDFIVPDGDDGFTGMFVRRAAEGKGPLAARGVTAVWDSTANKGITKDTKVSMQAFGVQVVYLQRRRGLVFRRRGSQRPSRQGSHGWWWWRKLLIQRLRAYVNLRSCGILFLLN